MTDAYDALRLPLTPADPDPDFAAALRSRVERALALPPGVQMLETVTRPQVVTAGRASLTPYLAVSDARRAIDWYADVLAAELVGAPIVMPDSRIGHAELLIGGTRLYLSDAHPEIGVVAPGAGNDVTLHLEVLAVDALVALAVEAGATLDRPPADYPYGRSAVIRDPFGHRWMLDQPPGAEPLRHGDLIGWALRVPDAERARSFYAAVLGAPFPGPIVGGYDDVTAVFAIAVNDLRVATDAATSSGAVVGDVVETAGAATIEQDGLRFVLQQLTPGALRPAQNGAGAGDVAYLTLDVRDSARARALLTAVAGWGFEPGRVADGWQAVGPAPMAGLSGGHEVARVRPMYRVDDVDRAVAAVRALGGPATEPERQPYGVTAECTDDQGGPFFLGQLA